MAERLLAYYKYMGSLMGFEGQIKLASATKIPSTKAALEADSPEKLMLFERAIVQITGKPAPRV